MLQRYRTNGVIALLRNVIVQFWHQGAWQQIAEHAILVQSIDTSPQTFVYDQHLGGCYLHCLSIF